MVTFGDKFDDVFGDVFGRPVTAPQDGRQIIAQQLLQLAQAMQRYARLLGEQQEREAKRKARA